MASLKQSFRAVYAALALATAAFGEQQLLPQYSEYAFYTKIAALLVLIVGVWRVLGRVRSDTLLLLALVACWLGDVFLLFPQHFVPGLVAFLCGHVLYIIRMKRDSAWFANKLAGLTVFAIGGSIYSYLLQGGLPQNLHVPVAAYVIVISLMGAQAIGRYSQHRTSAASRVALGAVLFLISDTLLAVNKFHHTLPYGRFLVLATYYLAQDLIAWNFNAI